MPDSTSPAAATVSTGDPTTPVGTWHGSVSHDGQVDEYDAVLGDDGTLSMTTPISDGVGDWRATGPDTFSFSVTEVFHPDAGMPAAYVRIVIDARWSGPSFTGLGRATIHAEDGTQIYATAAETTARRVARPVS